MVDYAAFEPILRFRFRLVLGGRGAVSPSGTSRCARSSCTANGTGGIGCRHAAHWHRDWYMLCGLLRTSRASRAARRRDFLSFRALLKRRA
jgi:hypothetical protein